MPKYEITKQDRPSAYALLKPFCPFADTSDCLTVTKWVNGEGYDVEFLRRKNGDLKLQFTTGELIAIHKLYKSLTNDNRD